MLLARGIFSSALSTNAKRKKSFWNVPEKPSVSLTFFFRKRFLAAGGTRHEVPLLAAKPRYWSEASKTRSEATRNTQKSAKGLEENFVFLFAFFASQKSAGKGFGENPGGVFPKQFRWFDAGEIAKNRPHLREKIKVISKGKSSPDRQKIPSKRGEKTVKNAVHR